jgi:hypothetical protein
MSGQWLTAAAGVEGLKSEATTLARRIVRRAMLTGLVGLLWLVAGGFAVAGFSVWLAGLVGIVAACAIVAAILAAAALAIQLGMSVDKAPSPAAPAAAETDDDPPRHQARDAGNEDTVSDDAALAGAAFVSLAGYMLGRMVKKT